MKIGFKLTLLTFVTGVTALIALAAISHFQDQETLLVRNLTVLQSAAQHKADMVEDFLKSESIVTGTLAHSPLLLETLLKSNQHFGGMESQSRSNAIKELNNRWKATKNEDAPFIKGYTENQAARLLDSHVERNPGVYGEIFVTNRYGAIIATTGRLTTLAHAHKYWWVAAYNNGRGRVFFDDRGYDTSVGGYVVGVVVPIYADNEIVGIIKANVNLIGPLKELVAEHNASHVGQMRIARSKGMVVVEEGSQPLSTTLPKMLSEALSVRKPGALRLQGSGRLFSYAPVPITLGDPDFGFGGNFESIDQMMGNTGEAWMVVLERSREEALKPLKAQIITTLKIGGGLILILALLAVMIGNSIANPIALLSKTTRLIGKGNFDVRVSTKGRNELSTLGQAFNTMAANLKDTTVSLDRLSEEVVEREKAEEQLQILNAKLEERVIERTKELEDAMIAAESANKLKSAFLANMSHELYTPMNAIMGMSQLALNKTQDPEVQETIRTVLKSSNNLLGLVHDLLDFSEIDKGVRTADVIPFSLKDLLESFAAETHLKAENKRHELTFNVAPDVPINVSGDPQRLKKVLWHIADNAIKFTDPGGRIEINVSADEVEEDSILLHISIKDSGIGLKPDDHKMLFKSFTQVDGSSTRQHGGTGLGLAYSHMLVEMMGGEINVESDFGKGSTFHFHVRLTKQAGQQIYWDQEAEETITANEACTSDLDMAVVEPKLIQLNEVLQESNADATSLIKEIIPFFHGTLYADQMHKLANAVNSYDFDLGKNLLNHLAEELKIDLSVSNGSLPN